MIQDIPDEIYGYQTREEILANIENCHRNYNYDSPLDTINLTGYHFHTILYQDNNSLIKPFVLSAHHQCIENVGMGLMPIAWSEDKKIIEAVKHEKYKGVTGVQFHPEKSGLFNDDDLSYVTADSTINYKSFIQSTDFKDFHRDFWRSIGGKFLNSSSTPFQ